MDHLAELRAFHQEYIEPYTGLPVGASEEEVQALEKTFGFVLPEAYRQWLRWMGQDFEGVFHGEEYFIRFVRGNTDYLPKLLEDCGIQFALPKHYLVFYQHEGYVAAWFELPTADENPIVWYYAWTEDNPPPHPKGRFTDFILADMKTMAKHVPGRHKRDDI